MYSYWSHGLMVGILAVKSNFKPKGESQGISRTINLHNNEIEGCLFSWCPLLEKRWPKCPLCRISFSSAKVDISYGPKCPHLQCKSMSANVATVYLVLISTPQNIYFNWKKLMTKLVEPIFFSQLNILPAEVDVQMGMELGKKTYKNPWVKWVL